MSIARFPSHWPGSRGPCWRTWRSYGTLVCCTCSCPAQPGACGRRSQFSPLWSYQHTINTKALFEHMEEELASMAHAQCGAYEAGVWVIRNSLTSPPPELHFISLEVGLVFHHFDETLRGEAELTCSHASFNRALAHKYYNYMSAVWLCFTVLTVSYKRALIRY